MKIMLSQFAAANETYNCGAYSAGNYNVGECRTSTGGGTGDSTGGIGDIAGTGMNVLLPLLIGLALIIGSAVYFVRQWRKHRRENPTAS